jgi:hypothetical protein
MNMPAKSAHFWRILLLLALLLYLLAGTYQLDLPGLNQDEAADLVPAMQVVRGLPLDNAARLTFAGRDWPLMIMPYIGATSSYLLMLPFAIFGVSLMTLRATYLFIGLLTLLLAWGFLRDYLDARVASLSVLLLAVNPSYVFWTRTGAYVSLPLLPLGLGMLWALYRWTRDRKPVYLVCAAFCFGLGLSTKILFVWLAVGLALAWLLLTPGMRRGRGLRGWLWPVAGLRVGAGMEAVAACLAGGAMLLVYNLPDFPTLRLILLNASRTQLYGVSNLNLLGNLRTVIFEDFPTFLDGSWFKATLGVAHANPLAAPALALALLVLLCLRLTGRSSYSPQRLALLVILMVSIVVQSAVTITNLGANHLILLWPIPQALICAALLGLADTLSLPAGRRNVLVGAAVGMLMLAEAGTTLAYHQTLAQTGGVGHSSDAISALANDLDARRGANVIALDWGFRRNIQLLTAGRVNPQEWFTYTQEPGDEFKGYADQLVTRPGALYLFHAPAYTAFAGHWPIFEEAAYRHHLAPVLWKSYSQRDGRTVYLVYTLEPMPKLADLPPTAARVSAQLGDGLALLGYDAADRTVQPGTDWNLTLYWRAAKTQDKSYKVFVHLIGADGRMWAQHDGVPLYWGYPTTAWAAGEIVGDPIRLAIGKDTPPGTYRVLVGMYDEASQARLPLLSDGKRQENDALALTELTVGHQGD